MDGQTDGQTERGEGETEAECGELCTMDVLYMCKRLTTRNMHCMLRLYDPTEKSGP
jgi:hypothetical protein